jgi:hypothetical protein
MQISTRFMTLDFFFKCLIKKNLNSEYKETNGVR